MGNFDEYFHVRKNIIFERAGFNRRNQLPDETAKEYITVLFNFIDSCNYGNLRDEMLLDRLVVGIRDVHLSERLQMDPELTLEKTMKMVRQREAIHEHNTQLQGIPASKDSGDVSLMKNKSTNGSRQGTQSQKRIVSTKKAKSRKVPQGPAQCTPCGKNSYSKAKKCPASTATCLKCNQKVGLGGIAILVLNISYRKKPRYYYLSRFVQTPVS